MPSHGQVVLQPAESAFAAYRERASRMGEQPVVVIEGGYFEQREPDAADRIVHLQDSFTLADRLMELPSAKRPELILSTLINDFPSESQYCDLAFQGADSTSEPGGRPQKSLCRQIPAAAKRVYEQHTTTLVNYNWQHFSMKSTRNRAARFLTRSLKTRNGNDAALYEVVDGDVVDIFVTTDEQDRYLGCRHAGSFRMSLRCTALMAQHYYDLCQHAQAVCPRMTGLWIFDFDRFTERDRVRAGAEASFALHPWPAKLPVHVVNCIYYPDAAKRQPLQVTSRI